MIAYQRKILSTATNIGNAGTLPDELFGLTNESLADLSWTDPALGYGGQGFVPVYAPAPPSIPAQVPMYKARKVLIIHGLTSAIEDALAGMTGEAGDLARVDWEYAPNLVRYSPLVENLANAVGLTSDQIDALVIEAAALP
jgi:hypothetical protein